jgi:hypothetical protein
MTWRDGFEYWRAWARITDGDVIEDAPRICGFYEALVQHRANLDDAMPPDLVQHLGMDK